MNMHILEKQGCFSCYGATDAEAPFFISLAWRLKKGQRLYHCGHETRADGLTTGLRLYSKDELGTWSKVEQDFTRSCYEPDIGVITLRAETDENVRVLTRARYAAAMAGSLTVNALIQLPDEGAVVLTGGYCPRCGSAMSDPDRCAWDICPSCAKKCDHEYEERLAASIGQPAGFRFVCRRCGLFKRS